MNNRRNLPLAILAGMAILIKLFSLSPASVEHYYSRGLYPAIAVFQRVLFGWIPFSLGDIFYLAVVIFLLGSLFSFIRKLVKKKITRDALKMYARRWGFSLLLVYVVFNALWGLNYNRVPMAQSYGLAMDSIYATADLTRLVTLLTDSLNMLDQKGISGGEILKTKRSIFNGAITAYGIAGAEYPALKYTVPSVKPSLFSYLGNYFGFSGYYDPFSGEAQVNTTVPAFVQPFVACHEIGHQLGYAKEDEANFAGFLSARRSPNDVFVYSMYFDMYGYAGRELYGRDSTAMISLGKRLRPRIRKDYDTLMEFYRSYSNPLEPLIRKMYARYLVANQQPAGMRSYNEVVAMLIAFYKKQGLL